MAAYALGMQAASMRATEACESTTGRECSIPYGRAVGAKLPDDMQSAFDSYILVDCKAMNMGEHAFCMAEQRAAAIQKLVAVRNFAHADCEPCRVIEGLFIGSLGAARNLEALRKRGVTHIVNASPIVPCFHRGQFRYKAVPVYDDADEDIARHFPDSCRFIARGRRKGAVLVHCYAGQSRSVAFVLAYLCAHQGLSVADAYALVLAARPSAKPNAGFMRQLVAFEQQLQEGPAAQRRGADKGDDEESALLFNL